MAPKLDRKCLQRTKPNDQNETNEFLKQTRPAAEMFHCGVIRELNHSHCCKMNCSRYSIYSVMTSSLHTTVVCTVNLQASQLGLFTFVTNYSYACILIITINRYFAVCKPITYKVMCTFKISYSLLITGGSAPWYTALLSVGGGVFVWGCDQSKQCLHSNCLKRCLTELVKNAVCSETRRDRPKSA